MEEAGERYDAFWSARGGRRGERLRRRSLQRAEIAAGLLGPAGGERPRRLLDLGCGPGHVAAYFAARGFDVLGLEASPRAAEAARAKGVPVVVCDIERDELPEGPFDAVLALEVLEHLIDPLAALRRLLALPAPQGRLVISLPNEFHLLRRLAVLLGAEPFGGHDDPHVRHFGLRGVRRLLRAAGAEAAAVRGCSLVPPGLPLLAAAGRLLARVRPSLFSICLVAEVRRAGEAT